MPDILAIVVTYGKRKEKVLPVVKRALEETDFVVVVENAIEWEGVEEYVSSPNLKVIKTTKNLGSAGGFKLGLEFAVSNVPEGYVVLLDDDNILKRGVVKHLLKRYAWLLDDRTVIQIARLHRHNAVFLKRYIVKALFGYYDTDMIVDVKNIVVKMLKVLKILDRDKEVARLYPYVEKFLEETKLILPVSASFYPPWGGKLFNIKVVKRNGFPDERMFLYGDDTEWNLRLKEKGGRFFVTGFEGIVDLEDSRKFKSFAEDRFEFFRERNLAYLIFKYFNTLPEVLVYNLKTIIRSGLDFKRILEIIRAVKSLLE